MKNKAEEQNFLNPKNIKENIFLPLALLGAFLLPHPVEARSGTLYTCTVTVVDPTHSDLTVYGSKGPIGTKYSAHNGRVYTFYDRNNNDYVMGEAFAKGTCSAWEG